MGHKGSISMPLLRIFQQWGRRCDEQGATGIVSIADCDPDHVPVEKKRL
jgi:hypothetical protein